MTNRMTLLPDLSRTKAALEAFDAADITPEEWEALPVNEWLAKIDELDKLGEGVGRAYGLDTSDRNDPEVCRKNIRPGPKTPGAGQELSFVRRMVAAWEGQS